MVLPFLFVLKDVFIEDSKPSVREVVRSLSIGNEESSFGVLVAFASGKNDSKQCVCIGPKVLRLKGGKRRVDGFLVACFLPVDAG